ncbi:hypothetical protein [Pedobacter alpinus]|uniref:Tetratricopeptide repeat-containing protein n=1 Tax=Pedobacter alpinus TaxID=1590643 RepID=A0ABW5TN97_9SPHI
MKNIFFFFLFLNFYTNSFCNTADSKITLNTNPTLISDSLKKSTKSLIIRSSLNQLDQNIYLSSLNDYSFLKNNLRFFDNGFNRKQSKFNEILAINALHNNDLKTSLYYLNHVFTVTTDSLQKAKTTQNLIKIYQQIGNYQQAQYFIYYSKQHYGLFLTFKERYNLQTLEAKNAFELGFTKKAENIIIQQLLPKSNRFGGKYAEYKCYLLLGKVYLKAKSLVQAKWFFIQANSLAIQQNNTNGRIETYLLLARAKIIANDKNVALEDLAKARELIGGNNSIYLVDLNKLYALAKGS